MEEGNKPKTSRKTISLPSEIFEAGAARAAADQRDFSNYLAVLITKDVERANRRQHE